MNAHETALAAHTRAESAAQAKDTQAERIASRAVDTLFTGNEVRYGRDVWESISPLECFDEESAADLIEKIGQIRAMLRKPRHDLRDMHVVAMASALVAQVEIVLRKTVDLHDAELMDDELRTAAMEAKYDRAERAQ